MFELLAFGVLLVIIVYGFLFFMVLIGYSYLGLSIVMAPIVWLLLFVGLIVGLVITIKNAYKAAKETIEKGVE